MPYQKLLQQIVSVTFVLFPLAGCMLPTATPVPVTPAAAPTSAAPSPGPEGTPTPVTPTPPQQTMAYVSSGRLYLALYNGAATRQVDGCPAGVWCFFSHLNWSPDGVNLAYLKTIEGNVSLMMVSQDGVMRMAVDSSPTLDSAFTPTWSPDGQRLIYAVRTDDYLAPPEEQPADDLVRIRGGLNRTELWVIDAPFPDPGRKTGEIYIEHGCGGAGYSISEQLYWREGLATFPHATPSLRLAWTPGEILLYSLTCAGTGLGRFDLKTSQILPPLDEANLLAFTVDLPRQRWAAMSQRQEVALGDPNQMAFTLLRPATIPDPAPLAGMPVTGTVQLGGVFFGPTSGRLYYTTRQLLGSAVIEDAMYRDLMPGPALIPFDFYQTTLFVIKDANQPQGRQLLQTDDYGYGSLTETVAGDLLFVRIDNGRALHEAMQARQPIEILDRVWPKPQIVRLRATGGAPEVLADNAGQLALAPPPFAGAGAPTDWLTYTSEPGQFSLRYPAEYNLYLNATPAVDGVIAARPDSVTLHKTAEPSFLLHIHDQTAAEGRSLADMATEFCLIQQAPASITLAGQAALLFEDTACGPAHLTIIAVRLGQTVYRVEIEHMEPYATIEPFVMSMLATFQPFEP